MVEAITTILIAVVGLDLESAQLYCCICRDFHFHLPLRIARMSVDNSRIANSCLTTKLILTAVDSRTRDLIKQNTNVQLYHCIVPTVNIVDYKLTALF